MNHVVWPVLQLLGFPRMTFRLCLTARHFWKWVQFYITTGMSCQNSINFSQATNYVYLHARTYRLKPSFIALAMQLLHTTLRECMWAQIMIVWGCVWCSGYECVMLSLFLWFYMELLLIALWDQENFILSNCYCN